VEESNLMRFMKLVGVASFQELLKRSIDSQEWFWETVSNFLQIEWYSPYSLVKDESMGKEWTKWFVGGKINIVHNCIDKHSSKLDDKTALICESEDATARRVFTYKQLSELTNKVADALRSQLGVERGDRVGLYMEMSAEAVATFFAIIKIGAVVVPVFSGYGKDAISSRLRDCAAKTVVVTEYSYRRGKKIPMLDTLLLALRDVPSVAAVLVSGESRQIECRSGNTKIFNWECVLSGSSESKSEVMDAEDPFLIIYTSGTTGKPKGAVHVHGGFLVKIAEEMAFQIDLKSDDVLFWLTDMGWIMAPWELVGAFALGGTILVYSGAPDYPTAGRLWEVVESNGVTKLGVSPTLIRALKTHGDEDVLKHDLTSLQLLGSTGEPWDPESYRWLFKIVGNDRCPIINLSGGTEVAACFLSVHPIVPIKACSLGGPSLGIDADVVDETGKSVRNRTGDLVVRSSWPSMTRGLWRDPERYIQSYWSKIPNVWIHGDWASIDTDGYWFLHGRSDDTIKVAGKRIGPGEVESSLATHESVLESVAIGIPDKMKGEIIACFVVLKPNFKPSELVRNDLTNLVAATLGESMRPGLVKFVTAIPRTRNAKLVRRLVKCQWLGLPLGDTSNIEDIDTLEAISSAR
ncbi:MAG: AMP-binding protein, partial [Nitrososphaerota archaeon]|nr:AMP-binding protein [Nitrososphaerota archaeon]